jgi:hypothetical protein
LLDDQLVLGVDRDLNVVADAGLRMRGHRAAVGIGERDLVLAGSVELGQHRLVTAALLAERRDLLGQVLRARTAAYRAVFDIALVEPLEVVFQPLVGRADELSQRRAGEVAVVVVDRLVRVPSTASNSRPYRSSRRHKSTNWRKRRETPRDCRAESRRRS